MSFIRVTDNAESGTNMFYLYNQISPLVSRLNGKAEIYHSCNNIDIDCGATFGGKLACLRLDDMQEFYV